MNIFTTLRDKSTHAVVSDYNWTCTAFSSRCRHDNQPVTARAWNTIDGEISRNLFMRNTCRPLCWHRFLGWEKWSWLGFTSLMMPWQSSSTLPSRNSKFRSGQEAIFTVFFAKVTYFTCASLHAFIYRDASHLWRSFSHNRTKINIQFFNERQTVHVEISLCRAKCF